MWLNGLDFGLTATTTSGSVAISALAAQTALSQNLPLQSPSVSKVPTISMTSGVPAATPTSITAWLGNIGGGNGLNPAFTFSGGTYERVGSVFPYYNQATMQRLPIQNFGFGRAVVDFYSDSPSLTYQLTRQAAGAPLVIEVDGVEQVRANSAIQFGTAQAGGASTITLDSTASTINGFYFNQYVNITGGTGIGQTGLITAYVGSTKVATVSKPWAVAPDATSTFEVVNCANVKYTQQTAPGNTFYYINMDWAGERRMRHYRITQDSQGFPGVYVTSLIDSVLPCPKPTGPQLFWLDDSFGFGTGQISFLDSLAAKCAKLLGMELVNLSIGGTGLLNPGPSGGISITGVQRIITPPNAWFARWDGTTAGTWTFTQRGITVTSNYNDSITTMQSNFDTAFGAGTYICITGNAATLRMAWIVGQGSEAALTSTATASFAGLTGAVNAGMVQYIGDMQTRLKKDGNGNVIPFIFLMGMGHNDTPTKNAAYTAVALQAAATTLISYIQTTYPTCQVISAGAKWLGGAIPAEQTAVHAAILAAQTAVGTKINGNVAFIDTQAATYPPTTGTGNAGNLQGNGNNDVMCYTDATHPTPEGAIYYGNGHAKSILALYGLI